jgi:tetratricopeptide (TPR) repeat protein
MKEFSMIRSNGFDMSRVTTKFAALFLAVSLAGIAVADADAQRRRDRRSDEQSADDAGERVFSAAVGEIVLEAQNLQAEDRFAESIGVLNRALAVSSINPYERSIALQMRGRSYYETERTPQAISDWEAAIATGSMLASEVVTMRINIGQLYISSGDYTRGINSLQQALRDGGELTARLAKMMAGAYAQAERYSEGLQYVEYAFANTSPLQRGDYQLILFFYQQLDNVPGQMRIIEQMVERWPTVKSNWTSYAAMLAQTGRETDAFEANKIMYINGMLTEGREILRVAQYYSFYEYPYRGAVILEREMNAGRVESSQRNLSLLANMWRQSREWERAIPVLRQVAQVTGGGDDYQKLAEALYQRNHDAEAETAFQEALNRGGIGRPGDTWALLGTVRYELGRRQSAIAAFREAARFPYSRRTANGWITFINAEINGEANRARIRVQVRQDECRFAVEDELTIATLVGEVNDEGRLVIDVPDRCTEFYNEFGEDIAELTAAAAAAAEAAEAEGEEAG